jgi:hypothetical protein
MDAFGWQPFAVPTISAAARLALTAHAERQYDAAFRDFRIGPGARQALDDLLDCCRRERIRTALVLMPEGTAFQERYPRDMQTVLQQFLNELCGRYGAGLIDALIDARHWIADADFSDSHHLLPAGATAFSDRLAEVICGQRWEEARN